MRFTMLTRDYLPGFIHLVDSIIDEEENIDYKKIAVMEGKDHETVDPRSIRRAFELRQKMMDGWDEKKRRPARPREKTLDVLVAFSEGHSKSSFLKYCSVNKNEIEAHFVQNRPDQEWIDKLFGDSKGKVGEKISAMEDQRDDLKELLDSYSLEGLKEILEPRARQQLSLLLEEWKSDALEPFFKGIMEQRIKKLEDKITSSKKLHRRLGILSLLFLPQDDELTFEEDFFSAIEEYQVDVPSGSGVDEPLLDLISKLSN